MINGRRFAYESLAESANTRLASIMEWSTNKDEKWEHIKTILDQSDQNTRDFIKAGEPSKYVIERFIEFKVEKNGCKKIKFFQKQTMH